MVFKVPQKDTGAYEFELDGATHSLPKFKDLSVGDMRELAEAEGNGLASVTAFLGLFARLVPDAHVDQWTIGQIQALIEDWQADAGVTVGESEASPNS